MRLPRLSFPLISDAPLFPGVSWFLKSPGVFTLPEAAHAPTLLHPLNEHVNPGQCSFDWVHICPSLSCCLTICTLTP